MRIQIACPVPSSSRFGNRQTATRWAKLLKELGHRVRIVSSYDTDALRKPCDLFVALHARRSAKAIASNRKQFPDRPILLALTGTDLYRDIHSVQTARQSIRLADRLIVLHDGAGQQLPRVARSKVRVIIQSATPTKASRPKANSPFRVTVVGHLRRVKDPFRAAMAVRDLPECSHIQVTHFGGAREERLRKVAIKEMERNHRYQWKGNQPRWQVRRRVASSHLMVLSSTIEGGATVISEALADKVPLLCSRIPSSVGLLGKDYSGFFPVKDAKQLRSLLLKAETDVRFLQTLRRQVERRSPMVRPEKELQRWRELLSELGG